MRVLVTDGDERSALAMTRALGQQQIQVAVGAETGSCLAGTSKACWKTFTYPSPYTDEDGFVSQLLNYIRRFEIGIIFPVSDIAALLVVKHRLEFEKLAVVPMPPTVTFECLSDKYRLFMLAGEMGVPVPETFYVPAGRIAEIIDKVVEFPVVVKSARSVVKLNERWRRTGVLYANCPGDLVRFYRDLDYLQLPSLIQRRIGGEGQGVSLLVNHGTPVAMFAHKRLREKPPSGGTSVLRESIALTQPMSDYALRLLRPLRWHGVAMVEFKVERETGIPRLIEVNGRFWGSLQLAIDAGVNFPFMLYQLSTGQALTAPVNGYVKGIKSRWLLGDLDHLLLRLLKPSRALDLAQHSPSKLKTLLEFMRFYEPGLHYEVLCLSDPKPFLHELSQYVKNLRAASQVSEGAVQLAKAVLLCMKLSLSKLLMRIVLLARLQDRVFLGGFPKCVKRLLCVCQGNICRSPLAAAYLEAKLHQRRVPIVVASAGLETTPGKEAHPLAKIVAEQHGLSLASHRTMSVTRQAVEDADLIVVMEVRHREQLLRMFPEVKRKVYQLGHFNRPMSLDIEDPYVGNVDDFKACFQVIQHSCDHLFERLDMGA